MCKPKTFTVIGCGKLGKTIAKLLMQNGLELRGIYNHTQEGCLKAQQYLNLPDEKIFTDIHTLPKADAILITVPDDVIESTAKKLPDSKKHSIVIHFSGAKTLSVLEPARKKGYQIASLHPVKSFSHPDLAVQNFPGTLCGFSGNNDAYTIVSKLFSNTGAQLFKIADDDKTLYHAACCFAANYSVVIAFAAEKLLERTGIDRETANQIVLNLLSGTIQNIQSLGIEKSLTGPIQRRDHSTIAAHIDVLAAKGEKFLELYKAAEKVACDMLE